MSRAIIIGKTGVYTNSEISINDGEEIVFGRDSDACQIVYTGKIEGVSRVHCKVVNKDGKVQLIDLNSSNGTYLKSGKKLVPNVPYLLGDGEGFYLSSPQNSFSIKIVENQQVYGAVQNVSPAMGGQYGNANHYQEIGQQSYGYNGNYPMQNYYPPRSNSKTPIIVVSAIAALAVIVTIGIAYSSVKKANIAAQEAVEQYEEANDMINDIQETLEMTNEELEAAEKEAGTWRKIKNAGKSVLEFVFN